MLCVEGPQWEPPQTDPQTTLGFLILDGLIARRLRIDSAVATELLGCGDVLRPGDEPGMANFIPPEIDWQVYSPARVAVLDERLTTLLTTRPELVVAVSHRMMRRARSQSYLLAVSHFTRVEDRLMATFWHLASSWGRVTSHGILIPFRLTHAMLAELVGAQRPSVSLALKGLSCRGHVVRRPDGTYLLTGEPTDWIHRADDG
jgi:CRP-like cAMP-binding protein